MDQSGGDSHSPTKVLPGTSDVEAHVVGDRPRHTRRQYFLMASMTCANFILASSYSLLAPLFPQEAETKGATATEYGLVFGIFQLIVFISAPIFSKLTKYIRPHLMLRAGLFLAGSCGIWFGCLDFLSPGRTFIILAFTVRSLEAFGYCAVLTCAYSISAMEFSDRVGTVYAVLETAFALGLTAGPFIGGALYEIGNYVLPFAVIGSLEILIGILTLCMFGAKGYPLSSVTGDYRHFVLNGNIITDVVILFLCFMALGFNEATLEPHVRQFNLSTVMTSLIFVVAGGVDAISAPVFGMLCEKVSDPQIISLVGCALCIITFLLVGPAPFIPLTTTYWTVVISQVFLGLAMSAMIICSLSNSLQNALKRDFPNDVSTYAMVTALFQMASSAGCFIGPSIGGFLLDHVGYHQATVYQLLTITVVMTLVMIYKAYVKLKLWRHRDSNRINRTPVSLQENPKPLLLPVDRTDEIVKGV